ncbi:MaoC/PaaZ C-terminal domain-containing protein [Nocardioides sp. QY071]|nr:MaoC/PaaZ C-terminal domain-containing protein [Nocardioides sp. QY071]WGY00444.1 MaoC/PaaZ C-terminal domain-containing protein [Nocardioides sp. QY071]
MEARTSLPVASFGPITRSMLREYAAASGDNNPLHLNDAAAQRAGHREVIAQGMLSMAFVGRWVTSWCDLHELRSVSSRFTAATPLGSLVSCEGRLGSVHQGALSIDYSVSIDGTDIVTMTGRVVVDAAVLDRMGRS